MQCDVLDQEVQWIARGCVSDEALEQFGNPTTTGCTDEEDLPNDFRQGVIDATLGFYASVNTKNFDIQLVTIEIQQLTARLRFISRNCRAASVVVIVRSCAMAASQSTRQLPFE